MVTYRRLAIITAVHEEFCGILSLMQNPTCLEVANRKFYLGKFFGKQVILVTTGIGKVSASITTCLLQSHFLCDAILFIGTAAALSPAVELGDIVIGERFIAHDFNLEPLFVRGHHPDSKSFYTPANDVMFELAVTTSKAVQTDSRFLSSINTIGLNTVRIHNGLIVSGDQFLRHQDMVSQIISYEPFSDSLVADMESSGVAQAASDLKLPFVVARIVSDSATSSSAVDWQHFCKQVASTFGALFAEHFVSLLD
ncbi:hypothetical protein RCL1_001025 [Eukaryota sp. TZLM3-RCL]